MCIRDSNKRELGDWWRKTRFQSYEGITLPGFPNLFSIATPYAYNGLSFFSTIESQMQHMERCLGEMKKKRASGFEVTEEACTRFTDAMQANVGQSVFARGQCASANSYYYNPHGEAVLLRPTSTQDALHQQSNFPLNSYVFA